MKKVLFVATVVKHHIMPFHVPYLKWFKEKGYEVHVCAKNDYDNKVECNIPYCDKFYDVPFERSPFKLNNLRIYKEIKEIIDKNNYDIIHCHTPMGGAITRLAARETRNHGTKILYTAHGFHFYKGAPIINWLIYYQIEKVLSRYTDILITINKEDYDRAKKFKAKDVEYVPGVGIDTKKIFEISIDIFEKRKELGIPEKAFVLLSVGELNKNKNHETIIKAISKLKNLDVFYIICGQGALDSYLKEIINKLGLSNQVKMLGYRKDILDVLKVSDCFVFPSYREGLSLAMMEAMATGLPIICSNIRGNVDLIAEGKNGFLIQPNDVDGFAMSINKIIQNKSMVADMSRYSNNYITNFDINNVVSSMRKIYSEL